MNVKLETPMKICQNIKTNNKVINKISNIVTPDSKYSTKICQIGRRNKYRQERIRYLI